MYSILNTTSNLLEHDDRHVTWIQHKHGTWQNRKYYDTRTHQAIFIIIIIGIDKFISKI